MKITRTSFLSGVVATLDLDVTNEQLESYRNGALAQHVFLDLAPPEREFLISGITPDEWAREIVGSEHCITFRHNDKSFQLSLTAELKEGQSRYIIGEQLEPEITRAIDDEDGLRCHGCGTALIGNDWHHEGCPVSNNDC